MQVCPQVQAAVYIHRLSEGPQKRPSRMDGIKKCRTTSHPLGTMHCIFANGRCDLQVLAHHGKRGGRGVRGGLEGDANRVDKQQQRGAVGAGLHLISHFSGLPSRPDLNESGSHHRRPRSAALNLLGAN